MMYSPRSVSTTSMPAASRCALSPISSETIDLPLVTRRGVRLAAELEHDVARVRRGRREVHMPAALVDLPLVGFEIKVEMGERMVLDRARLVAQRVELRQLRPRQRALDDEAALDVEKRALQLGIGQRAAALCLEVCGVSVDQGCSPAFRACRWRASRSCRPAPRRRGGTRPRALA